MKNLLFTFAFLLTTFSLFAQKAAIIGISEDQPDGFTFVALEDLAAGTRIYFTTKEYQSGTCKYEEMLEEVAYWEAPAAGIMLGEVVFVQETEATPNVFTLACSDGEGTDVCGTFTLVSGSFNIGTQDEISLFGDIDNDITNGVDTVYSVAYHDHHTIGVSELPAANDPRGDEPCGSHTIVLDGLSDEGGASGHFQYTGPRTLPIYKENLENPANYTIAANAAQLDVTSFTGVSPAIEQAVETTDNQMRIYPNPVGGDLMIVFEKPLHADGTLEIYNIQGHLIQQEKVSVLDRNIYLKLTQFSAGTYLLKVISDKSLFVSNYSAKLTTG